MSNSPRLWPSERSRPVTSTCPSGAICIRSAELTLVPATSLASGDQPSSPDRRKTGIKIEYAIARPRAPDVATFTISR